MQLAQLAVIGVLLLHGDILCRHTGQSGTPQGKGMLKRDDVTFKFSEQPGNADGSVKWTDTMDMTVESSGKSPQTLKLKKKSSKSLGPLKKFKTDIVSFSLYSDGAGNSLVCKVTSNKQATSQKCRMVGIVNVEGIECIYVDGVTTCPIPPTGVLPPLEGRRKRDLESFDEVIELAREKRQTTPTTYNVEGCFTCDETFYNMFANNINLPVGTAEEDTVAYITCMVNEVDSFYSTIDSATMHLEIIALDIHISMTASDAQWANLNTNGVVNYYESLPQLKIDAETYFNTNNCDFIMALTRKDLSKNDSASGSLGVARGDVCEDDRLSIIEDYYRGTYVMAHELGHLLNASHDDSSNATCYDPAKIMFPGVGYPDAGNVWYSFSICSIEMFEEFVVRPSASCLTQDTFNSGDLEDQRCLGFTGHLIDTPEQECKRLYGVTTLCSYSITNPCNEFNWCRVGQSCKPVLSNDGFLCEDGTTKRCYKGECVVDLPTFCNTTTTTTTTTTTAAPTTTTAAGIPDCTNNCCSSRKAQKDPCYCLSQNPPGTPPCLCPGCQP